MSYYRTTSYRKPSRFGDTISTFALAFVLVVVLAAVFGLIAAVLVYFLWNWLMPNIFGLSTISYWQAWGLYFLAHLLFKGSSSSSSSRD